eukprot:709149-Pyramimonas_sp.AAC.1
MDLHRSGFGDVEVLEELQQPEAVVVAGGVELGREPQPQVVFDVLQLGLAHLVEHLLVDVLPHVIIHGAQVKAVVLDVVCGLPQAALELRVNVGVLVVGHFHLEARVSEAEGRLPVLSVLQCQPKCLRIESPIVLNAKACGQSEEHCALLTSSKTIFSNDS